ncbi:MAG: tetratricopeptide repeat protein [Candidatus Rokubacteria bacterium]|nr:tetratricopeptide repeat protein [Candidatus Rokubacteria bacterium]
MKSALAAWRPPTPRALLLGGAAVLALVLVAGGGWFWYSSQVERGQTVHAEALALAAAARSPQAAAEAKRGAMAALDTALTAAASAPLAAQSAYMLGDLRYEAGDLPGARAAYQVALAKTSSGTMRTLARAAVAATWEAERKFGEAVTAYTAALAEEKAGRFYYEDLLIGLARNQELAGRKDEAIQTYQRVLKDVPKAQLRREPEVRGRLASLGIAG